jgi:sugar-specific transcriptional regulator TrmB
MCEIATTNRKDNTMSRRRNRYVNYDPMHPKVLRRLKITTKEEYDEYKGKIDQRNQEWLDSPSSGSSTVHGNTTVEGD